jgi:hypothetical protein
MKLITYDLDGIQQIISYYGNEVSEYSALE